MVRSAVGGHERCGRDESQLAALVRRHEGVLVRVSRRLCNGDRDRAADLAQDALVRACEAYRCGNYDGTDARPWLLRILTNLYINDYRRRKRWEARIDLDTLTSSGECGPETTRAAPADVPGFALMAETLDEEWERALAGLPEGQRRCLLLVDVEGLEYAEAALALGVPVGTVRSRLARARTQLQVSLRDYARGRRLGAA